MALSYDEYLYVERYRHQAFEAAKDLGYSTETLDGFMRRRLLVKLRDL